MMKKKQEQSNKLPEKIDDLSDDVVQNKDCHNIDDCSVSDQEMLNEENDSFHIINNNYTTKKSYSPQRKRLSSFSSTSGNRTKKNKF
jgi:F0F1-type ATP synthase gamma subunit